mmetsp:Transcript_106038/g.296817  ORF Transcript_106038/g.296817 Transcript_106038/m.296817 type:complete len:265 (+) Transcript_106038:824-1618(+)
MPQSSVACRGSSAGRLGLKGQRVISSVTASRMKSMNSSASKDPPPSSSIALKAIMRFLSGASCALTSRIFRKNRRISSGPRAPSPPAVSMMPSSALRLKRASSCTNVMPLRWIARRTARLTCVNTNSFKRWFLGWVRTKARNSWKLMSPPPSRSIELKNWCNCLSETRRSAIFRRLRIICVTSEKFRVPVPLRSHSTNNFLKNSVSFCRLSFGGSCPVCPFFAARLSKARTRRMVPCSSSSSSPIAAPRRRPGPRAKRGGRAPG